MKTTLSLILMLCLGARLLAADLPKEESNYVVIGAFASQENAIHFTETAKKKRFDARFEMNPNRNLFYVYVLHTENKQLAVQQAQDLRKRTPFSDTWVYTGFLGDNTPRIKGIDTHPETGEKLQQVSGEDKSSTVAESTPVTLLENSAVALKATEETSAKQSSIVEKDGQTFFFKLIRASNQKVVEGEVDVFDSEKQKKTASYSANQDVFVRTANRSGDVLLKCEPFGYRKSELAINLNNMQATPSVVVENGKVVVPFELVRLKKGDIAVMYNVFFYKDAAIMRPESRVEVTSLLEMMKENPKMKVRIHGHTNGGAAGKIIEPGDNKNFFSLSGTKEGFGTAKKLSEERAQIISDFLVSEGIDAKRLEIKAWGGKKPVFENDHAQAHTNVRVEIEIIEE
jgi:outer membrane protein OmpA-like peptidoglycan-associated protein